MMFSPKSKRGLPVSAAIAAAFSVFALQGAFGQATQPAGASSEVVILQNYTVTGSYIPSGEIGINTSVSPLTFIDRKVIDESGLATTSELLQSITVSNGGSVPISNNATGFTPAGTSLSLRGLGPEATLVLINGRRVAVYPVGTGGTTAFVDLNSIPLSAVESIEILKDGASALYGADAVAGVVNIKLRRAMDGTEVYLNYGNTTSYDSHEVIASVITGARSERASALIGFNYYSKAAIMNPDRPYSEIPPFLSTNSSPLNLQISPAAAMEAGITLPTNLASASAIFAAAPAETSNMGNTPASGYTYSAGRSQVFNFNEFSMSYPIRRNLGMFAFGERKILGTDNIKAYVDVSYQQSRTENQLAPSATGNFSGSGTQLIIPARTANPILTAVNNTTGVSTVVAAGSAAPAGTSAGPGTRFVNGLVQRSAPAGAFNPFNPFNVDITGGTRARLAEFGNRIYRNETDAMMIAAGIKGENIMGNWNFDASLSYSEIQDQARNTLVSSSRFNQLMNRADPIFTPGSATYIGSSTPYNPFGYYKTEIPSNSAIVDYGKITVKDLNQSRLFQAAAVISTQELFSLPAGPVGFAFGGDARQERLEQYPDAYGLTGDLIGSSPNAITRGQRKIMGIFAEFRVPLAKDVPGAYDLSLDAAVRHERFLTSDRDTTVPKFGIRWQPVDEDVTVRATWSEGFREPSLYELYSSPTAALTPITHPIKGTREPEQDITLAGNRRLNAEETKYYNVGIVWTPQEGAAKGFEFSLDYWNIEREGTVDASPQDTVNRFFGRDPDGDPAPGGLLPGESVLLFGNGDIQTVNSVFFNVGQTKAAGWDVAANYTWNTDRHGRFTLGGTLVFLEKFERANTVGAPLVDQVGQDLTGTGDDGYLEKRARLSFEWAYKNLNLNFSGRFTDGFEDFDPNGDPFQIESTWIFDTQVSYNFRDTCGPWLADTRLSIGARNLFDKDPPFASGFGGNSTGYPGFLYSSENRFVYVSLNRKL